MDSATLTVGQILDGTYELTDELGAGGMGVVYKAKHVRLPKFVAVKVLRGAMGADADIQKRFRREAEIASSLGHPHICQAVDFNTLSDGVPYLVLEFLEGQSLRERLTGGSLSLIEAMALIAQLGSGLAAAHRAGIVHRDLKPENIFLCAPPEEGAPPVLKILDFGISKIHGGTSALTRDGALMGTPFYMAPEQAKGESVDARADQFALSVIVYEMLTGRLPFKGQQPVNVLFQVVHQQPPLPSQVQPSLPPGFDDVIMRGLAKSARQRFADVTALIKALWRASGLPMPAATGVMGGVLITGPQLPEAGGPTGPTQPPRGQVIRTPDTPMTLPDDMASAPTVTPHQLAIAPTTAGTAPPAPSTPTPNSSTGPTARNMSTDPADVAYAPTVADSQDNIPRQTPDPQYIGATPSHVVASAEGGRKGVAVAVLALLMALGAGAGGYLFLRQSPTPAEPKLPRVAAPATGTPRAVAEGTAQDAGTAGPDLEKVAQPQRPQDAAASPDGRTRARVPKARRSAAKRRSSPARAMPPLAGRERAQVRRAWSALKKEDYREARRLGERLTRDLGGRQRQHGHAVVAASHCGLLERVGYQARMRWVTDPVLRRRVKAFCRRVSAD